MPILLSVNFHSYFYLFSFNKRLDFIYVNFKKLPIDLFSISIISLLGCLPACLPSFLPSFVHALGDESFYLYFLRERESGRLKVEGVWCACVCVCTHVCV